KYVAWHAGIKYNQTAKLVLDNPDINFNKISVGIEHEAFSNQDLTEIQYVSSAKLINEICQRHGIPKDIEHIIRHNSIRSDKVCPGLVNISKLIGLTFNPPTISEIETLKIKISLLQMLVNLYRSLAPYQKLGGEPGDERGE
ncbi:MAG: peptidoglycan recognition family protein, partial [Nanoarchaeota archaeon]